MFAVTMEHDVPTQHRGRPIKYPFREMEVGESFFHGSLGPSMSSAAYQYGKRHDMTFVISTVKGGKRCWRTA